MNFPWQKKAPTVGLDWGFKSWKWIRLQKTGDDRQTVDFLEHLSLPEEEEARLPLLRKYVAEQKLEGAPTAVAFHDERLHTRRLELPRMPTEDLAEAIRWQMRDVAEESLENYCVRHSLIGEKSLTDIVRLTLLGFAIHSEAIQKKRLFLEQIGLRPFFMEPAPVAMAAAVEMILPSQESGWIGCADLGLRHPYFLVLGGGRLHFVRPLSGLAGLPAGHPEYSSKLSVELQHALDAFFIIYQNEKIEKILLAGGGAEIPNLPNLISQNIAIPSEILNLLQKLDQQTQKPFLFGPALACAQLTP